MAKKTAALVFLGVGLFMLERTWLSVIVSVTDNVDCLSGSFFDDPAMSQLPAKSADFADYNHLQDLSYIQLSDLTASKDGPTTCPPNLFLREDKIGPINENIDTARRIPKIIHQTSKSRCLTKEIYDVTKEWEFPGWSYYFHDDEAVMRLLHSNNFPEFPYLREVVDHCILSGVAKADLWRYVALWQYGGVYSDVDAAPHLMDENTILDTDDGFFVVEQYHILSQYFMAVSPKHPLMYYAIHRTLLNLLQLQDTGKYNAARVTGPHALHAAYTDFRQDVGVKVDSTNRGNKPVWKGIFEGTGNRTITVAGRGEKENEYVWRSRIKQDVKRQAYEEMGMMNFQKTKRTATETGMSCLSAILHNIK